MKAKTKTPSPVDLDVLADAIMPRLLARLAMTLGAAGEPYSTRLGHYPPEFVGRPKVWRETAPLIPGATKLGRWWSISRSAYSAWVASRATPSNLTAAPPANDTDEPWSPAKALAEAGIRCTR